MTVGVKEKNSEQYSAKMQKGLVDTWNARFPAAQAGAGGATAEGGVRQR